MCHFSWTQRNNVELIPCNFLVQRSFCWSVFRFGLSRQKRNACDCRLVRLQISQTTICLFVGFISVWIPGSKCKNRCWQEGPHLFHTTERAALKCCGLKLFGGVAPPSPWLQARGQNVLERKEQNWLSAVNICYHFFVLRAAVGWAKYFH